MIIPILLFTLAIAALIWFFITARGHSSAVSRISELQGRTEPVDLLAFRNLVDPAEREYLRQHLPPPKFRRIQRERLRAALLYLDGVAGNAAVLLRLGEAARRSESPEVARAGEALVATALRVRIYALLARTKLYAGILLPGLDWSAASVSESYENLTGMVGRLSRLQHQRPVVRISAVL